MVSHVHDAFAIIAIVLAIAWLADAGSYNLGDRLFTNDSAHPAPGVLIGPLNTATPLGQIVVYAPTLTPVATAAAIQTVEQTFTVTGLATTDKVIVNGPLPTSLCPPTTSRVSAANTLAIGFTTLTAVACTPAAGAYTIVAIRS
jgi:hypothetical protein